MPCIGSSLQDRTFDCRESYSFTRQEWIPHEPYQFNCLETFGNTLQSPMELVFTLWENTHNSVMQVALVVLGVFTAVIGLAGVAIASIGEMMNPHASFRRQALNSFSQAQATLSRLNELPNEEITPKKIDEASRQIGKLYRERVLKEKLNLKEGAINRIWYSDQCKPDEQVQKSVAGLFIETLEEWVTKSKNSLEALEKEESLREYFNVNPEGKRDLDALFLQVRQQTLVKKLRREYEVRIREYNQYVSEISPLGDGDVQPSADNISWLESLSSKA
jgi:hypothetical protein